MSHFDPRGFRDIIITIKKGDEEQNYRFGYGSSGTQNNEFHTLGDLINLFNQTGMQLVPVYGARGNLILELRNNSQENLQVTIGGTLSNRIGIDTVEVSFSPNEQIQSKDLKIASYSTLNEVYDEGGNKFLLKSDFYLVDAGDSNASEPIAQKWAVKSAVYDYSGEFMVSQNEVWHEITFDKDGKPSAEVAEIEFKGNTINYSVAGSKKYTTRNVPYEESRLLETSQDGKPQGNLKDVRIDDNGIIFLSFSNGVYEPMGRIGIAAFVNDQG